jgi:hypothetical protein
MHFHWQTLGKFKIWWLVGEADLILPSVEFIAVFEQELIGGLETGCSAILDDRAGSRRWAELLHLKESWSVANVRRMWKWGDKKSRTDKLVKSNVSNFMRTIFVLKKNGRLNNGWGIVSTLGKGSQLKIENITRVSLSFFLHRESHWWHAKAKTIDRASRETFSYSEKKKEEKGGC